MLISHVCVQKSSAFPLRAPLLPTFVLILFRSIVSVFSRGHTKVYEGRSVPHDISDSSTFLCKTAQVHVAHALTYRHFNEMSPRRKKREKRKTRVNLKRRSAFENSLARYLLAPAQGSIYYVCAREIFY